MGEVRRGVGEVRWGVIQVRLQMDLYSVHCTVKIVQDSHLLYYPAIN